jgi:hypothetical protein
MPLKASCGWICNTSASLETLATKKVTHANAAVATATNTVAAFAMS